jgi:hypothetical protein
MSTDAVRSLPVPPRLTDDELTLALRRLATEERSTTAQLVAHLAEFDARRLHLAAGFPSLFTYCCEVLRLSEHATYNRIEAARAARRFPVILERLAEGSLNLATVRLLAPHLTTENHARLLEEAAGRSKRDVEELVARTAPRPDTPTSIRPMRAARWIGSRPDAASTPSLQGAVPVPAPSVTLVELRKQQPVVVLAPGRYEIRFTVSAETREKLRVAQDLLRHAVPDGDTAEVIDRALTALLAALRKGKHGGADKPRLTSSAPGPGSRHVPAAVRRAVWLRDGARCAFVSGDGRRCSARAFLEFHHLLPYARGGPATVENIALRCQAHNQYERDRVFGPPAGRERVGPGMQT